MKISSILIISCLQIFQLHKILAQENPSLKIQQQCQVSNCDKCQQNDPRSCLVCSPYYYLDSIDNQCRLCGPGSYYNFAQKSCSDCFENCQVCTGKNEVDCVTCNPGYSLQSDYGYLIGREAKCVECQVENCKTCPYFLTCQECLNGFGKNYKGQCTKCLVINCNNCDYNPQLCLGCQIGYQVDSYLAKCVQEDLTCLPSQYKYQDQCKDCSFGCLSCQDYNNCYVCEDGYVLKYNSYTYGYNCFGCHWQCKTCQGTFDHCTSCGTSVYKYLNQGKCVLGCPDGYYNDGLSLSCLKCDSNCNICIGQNQCEVCNQPGIYQLNNGYCSRICTNGTYEYYNKIMKSIDISHNNSDIYYFIDLIQNQLRQITTLLQDTLQCRQCSQQCQDCMFFDFYCVSCKLGYYLSQQNNKCVDTCPDGYYGTFSINYNTSICQQCSSSFCKQCTISYCIECYPPFELFNGFCLYQKLSLANDNGECQKDKPYKLNQYCADRCPNGMYLITNQTNQCYCHPTCSKCAMDNQYYEANCLSCNNITQKIYQYKCVDNCPDKTYEIKGDNLIIQNEQSGQCVNNCPSSMKIYYINNKRQCLEICPITSNIINGRYCVDQICPNGQILNLSLINITDTLDLTTIQNIACQSCPLQCISCNQQGCILCQDGYYLSQKQCISQCNPWQEQINGTCQDCHQNCTVCKQDMIFKQGNCYTPCYEVLGQKCNDDKFQIYSIFRGTGSLLGFLNPQNYIELEWSLNVPQWDANITLNSLKFNLTIYDQINLNQIAHTLIVFKRTPITIYANQRSNFTTIFDPDMFQSGWLIVANGIFDLTEYYLNGTQFTFQANIKTITFTTPLPQGSFTVQQIQDNQFEFLLDGFNPIFSISPKDYLYKYISPVFANDPQQVQRYKKILYRPYIIQVYAEKIFEGGSPSYIDPKIIIWENQSVWDPLSNYTYQFQFTRDNNTAYRFVARITSQWSQTVKIYSDIYQFGPTLRQADLNYYLDYAQKVLTNITKPSTEDIQKSMYGIGTKIDYENNNNNTNYCSYGKLNQDKATCSCFDQVQYGLIIAQSNIMNKTIQIIKNIIQISPSAYNLYQASKLLAFQTNDTCSNRDPQNLQLTLNVIGNLITGLDNNSAPITYYLLMTSMNIKQSWNQIKSYKRRILQRVEEPKISYEDYLKIKQNGTNSYDIMKIPQKIIINNLVDTNNMVDLLTNLYSTYAQDKESIVHAGNEIYFKQIQYDNNKSDYHAILKDVLVFLPYSSVQNDLQNNTLLNLVVISKQIDLVFNNSQIDFVNQKFLTINILNNNKTQLYSQASAPSNFQIYITYFQPINNPFNGNEECLQYSILNDWVSQSMDKRVLQGGSIICSANHLSNFALGRKLNTVNLYQQKQRQLNNDIGMINFIIMFLLYIFSQIVSSVLGKNNKQICSNRGFEQVLQKENQDDLQKQENAQKQMKASIEVEMLQSAQHNIPETQSKDEIATKIQRLSSIENQQPQKQSQEIVSEYEKIGSKQHEKDINLGPDFFVGQSQAQIVVQKTGQINELRRWRLYNFVLCIFPIPLSWAPSSTRLSIIFLWLSCYQMTFAILLQSPEFNANNSTDFIALSIITMIISNIFNYLFSCINWFFSAILCRSSFYVIKTFITGLFIFINLMITFYIYRTLSIDNLSKIHGMNFIFQFFINMGLFDLFSEIISKYPGIKKLRTMRNFKLLEF